ncbi:hypothetical protein P4H66_06265 [Paenibacillus dokdonensis]|uniref:Uncharacterized protein n=1 Tax=Paenibacillus dokdonensis TaxID=2567944 RepID=A0ABU6GJ91_9BACL|nr:hypothetical protein [Paenibacillus dokdonensis]MEC0239459.1 hypothetical protein [Paenibacillus dokdonensis]
MRDYFKTTYTADEYKRLEDLKDAAMEQNKLLNSKLDQAMSDISKHGQTIASLEQEREALLWQIERTVDDKVELPQDVAEALQSYRDEGHDVDYIIRALSSFSHGTPLPRLQVIKAFAANNRGFDLINALVNGYTVEPTPRDKVKQLIEKWYTDPGDVTDAELYGLSDDIIELLQTTS